MNLGAGDDFFALDDLATIVSAFINEGSGSDTYQGTRPRSGVTDNLFETFVL